MRDFERKIVQFELNGDNEKILAEAGKILIPLLPKVLDAFYARALADPTSKAMFKSQDRMDYARSAQAKHWTRLLAAQLDAEYEASVDRIGRTHARINLPLEVYMSAYAVASSHLLEMLVEHSSSGVFKRNRNTAKMIGVVSRAFAFDIEQVTSVTFAVWGEEQKKALSYLDGAILALSDGDLSHRIPAPADSDYPMAYDTVRQKINDASSNLEGIFSQVSGSIEQMSRSVTTIETAAEQLSSRTNAQAASLEETRAAMQTITSSAQSTAQNTNRSNDVAIEARDVVDRSAATVGETAQAMEEIQKTSEKVSNITSFIDDIAFQTNLLALNAGVEAARAGEAGRGFAVVAQEVRALAASASQAAGDIRDLITESSGQIDQGVSLVGECQSNLRDLVSRFSELATLSSEVSGAIQDQTSGLAEISASLSSLDDITQRNAGMVEDTNMQMRRLGDQAQSLQVNIASIKMSEEAAAQDMGETRGPLSAA